LRLKRGAILLIAGGAIIAVGFAIFSYYTVVFAARLLSENNYSVDPGSEQSIQQFISQNSSEGTYLVALPQLAGQPKLKIASPEGQTLVEQQIAETVTAGTFPIASSGNYTLTLANPSSDVLQASIVFGDQESIIQSGLGISPLVLALSFNFALYAGIAVIAAGIVITILDRRRISKMKQFGDTSDLV
jgi:uncharacterized membrane protein